MQDLSDKVHDWFERLCLLSPDPCWVILGGRFVECNQAAVQTLGYESRNEILGLQPSTLSPPVQADGQDSLSKSERMMAMALEYGQHRFDWIHLKADGSEIDVEVTLSSVTIDQQDVIYCAWRDISRRKQLERILQMENDRIVSILNKVAQPIFLKNNDHEVVFANDAFYTMFGVDREHALGKTLAEHVPENERKSFLAVDRHVLDTGIYDQREETLTLGDRSRTIITSKARFIDGDGDVFLVGSIGDITDLKHIEEELRQSQKLFSSMAENLPVAIYVYSESDQLCEYINPEFVALFGYTREDVRSVSQWWRLAYPDPEYRRRLNGIRDRSIQEATGNNGDIEPMETIVTCKDGTTRDISWSFVRLNDKRYAFGQDLTERKREERERAIAATAFNAQEGMVVTDRAGAILKVNEAFTRITGYSSDEVAGKNLRLLQSGRHDKWFYKNMWECITHAGYWEGEIWNRRKSGKIYPEFLTITAVKDSTGEVSNFVGTFSDITQRKAAADEIENLAFYDPLTGLPNRRLLLDRLRKALATINRIDGIGALLFLDLDNFKNLNDSLGHNVGDLLLQQVADRLLSSVRECDTVSRLGGDEFVVMLENLSARPARALAQASRIAKKVSKALEPAYQLGTQEYQCTASIGITMIDDPANGVDDVLKQADIAMYQSKNAGRNTISFFDPQMQQQLNESVALEHDLRKALQSQQFELFYQVQVGDTGNPVGAEALLRWHHPEQGLLCAEEFTRHAEHSGLMSDIENWALESACKTLQLSAKHDACRHLTLAVNVGAHQFRLPDFVSRLQKLINAHGVKADQLKLEVTESLLLMDSDKTVEKMDALQKIGVGLVLDDFGTGYSSLQHIKRVSLEQLKIDKSFVRNIETGPDDRAIVSTVIAMAKNLNLDVIAEGVETEKQKQFLADRGCNQFQGRLFGNPRPAREFVTELSGVQK